jgi:hypothetical protein
MALQVGSYSISDLLAVNSVNVNEFGVDNILPILQAEVAAHNRQVDMMMGDLGVVTTDARRRTGSGSSGEMVEVDEYGRVPTQKATRGQTVGFPLRKFDYAIGWTRDYLLRATPADLAQHTLDAERADLRNIAREVKRALFLPTNYTFTDYLVDETEIAVKRLLNADSSQIAEGPNGETFDGSTHSHYNANATLTAAAVTATVEDVVEHGYGADVRIYINRTNAAAFAALDDFLPYLGPRVQAGIQEASAIGTLDTSRVDDRAIGIWQGAYEVWVKPWVPANYLLVIAVGDARKPLAFRQHPNAGVRGLQLVAEIDLYPLRADYYSRYMGAGVWNRDAAAVLQFNNGTYSAPTIS